MLATFRPSFFSRLRCSFPPSGAHRRGPPTPAISASRVCFVICRFPRTEPARSLALTLLREEFPANREKYREFLGFGAEIASTISLYRAHPTTLIGVALLERTGNFQEISGKCRSLMRLEPRSLSSPTSPLAQNSTIQVKPSCLRCSAQFTCSFAGDMGSFFDRKFVRTPTHLFSVLSS